MRTRHFPVIAALVLTVWAYAPLSRAGFVYDDARTIQTTPVTSTQLLNAVTGIAQIHPRTLTVLSFWLTGYAQFTPNAKAYHLTNLALHLLVGLLLYWAALPALGSWGASIAAALFLVHPVNSQAVSYISARSELFVGIGVCLALGSALRGSLVGLILGTLIGIVGKETAVVAIPIAAWLLVRYDRLTPRLKYGLIALFVLGAARIAWPVLHYGELFHQGMAYSALGMIVRNVANTARLLSLFVWPGGFSIEHDVTVWIPEAILAGVAAWLFAFGVAWYWRARYPVILTALGFVVIALLPRLLLPYEEWITEHQLYTAMLGVCWGVGGWYATGLDARSVGAAGGARGDRVLDRLGAGDALADRGRPDLSDVLTPDPHVSWLL